MFSAARFSFCSRKQLARKGEKAPPESVLFRRAAGREGIGIFRNRWGSGLSLKFRCDGKEQKAPRGRPAKNDPAVYRFSVNFSAVEHARFLDLYEQSGLLSKAAFIKARVFNEAFRVVKTDRGTLEYVAKLTAFHAQFRAVGTNYNQVVKELHAHFSEKKTLALLYKLERATRELAAVGQQVVSLSEEFKQRW